VINSEDTFKDSSIGLDNFSILNTDAAWYNLPMEKELKSDKNRHHIFYN
jgi:hypothetical protein